LGRGEGLLFTGVRDLEGCEEYFLKHEVKSDLYACRSRDIDERSVEKLFLEHLDVRIGEGSAHQTFEGADGVFDVECFLCFGSFADGALFWTESYEGSVGGRVSGRGGEVWRRTE
jgi:hypothetical protein